MLEPGRLFARRYRIVREIGRGAMGVVYEAVHETLGHRVAIKVLKPAAAEAERAITRFEREARLAAKLESRHVVKVLDVDRAEDDVPFLVMELLEGRDLAQEVEQLGPSGVALERALAWGLAIADAMIAAHAAGIIHRDLKLSNVFLTDAGVVKVLDFGVAAFQAGEGADASTTTSVAGTPRYMAPEQLLGEAPNPASDVWALGVILYRLLGGRFPYDAPTMAAQMLAIMRGTEPLEVVAPQLPKPLAAVVHRALGRTLEERWPSMRAFRDALASFESTAPPPPTHSAVEPPRIEAPPPPARAPSRRWLGALAIAGVGLLAVALAARTTKEPSPAREPEPRIVGAAEDGATAPMRPTVTASSSGASPEHEPATTSMASAPPVVRRPPPTSATAPVPAPPVSTPRPASSAGNGFPTHL